MEKRKEIIFAENLSKAYYTLYGKINALKDITISIYPGITFLIGPNGSGKSTFIKILMGATKPSRGKVRVFGFTPTSGELKEKVRFYVSPQYLPKNLYVWELIEHVRKMYKVSKQSFIKVIEDFDLEPLLPYKFGALSSGMAQRVAISLTFIGNGDYLIFDEPFINFDPEWRKRIWEKIREHGNALIATHLSKEILDTYAPQAIIFINEGQIINVQMEVTH